MFFRMLLSGNPNADMGDVCSVQASVQSCNRPESAAHLEQPVAAILTMTISVTVTSQQSRAAGSLLYCPADRPIAGWCVAHKPGR